MHTLDRLLRRVNRTLARGDRLIGRLVEAERMDAAARSELRRGLRRAAVVARLLGQRVRAARRKYGAGARPFGFLLHCLDRLGGHLQEGAAMVGGHWRARMADWHRNEFAALPAPLPDLPGLLDQAGVVLVLLAADPDGEATRAVAAAWGRKTMDWSQEFHARGLGEVAALPERARLGVQALSLAMGEVGVWAAGRDIMV